MDYSFNNRCGHIEVLDDTGRFMFSADTVSEAYRELADMDREECKRE